MDFDRAAVSHPVIDVGWLADASNFKISAIFGCVAVIHYDLISSIVILNNETLNKTFVDEQHDWLMRWRELCGRLKV